MADQPSPHRFQFRLRTLMIVVTLMAAIFGGLRLYITRLDDEFRKMRRRDLEEDKRRLLEEEAKYWKRPPPHEDLTAGLAIPSVCGVDPRSASLSAMAEHLLGGH